MAELQYIGARYIPKFYENPDTADATWKSGVAYEALTVVTYNQNSYTSKIPVPSSVGDPASNNTYWIKTADWNAQLASLQNEINILTNDVKSLKGNKIIFMPVGDTAGNCTVCVSNTGKVLMFDTGYTDVYLKIKNVLTENNIDKIDYFLLSHYHADHFGNLTNLQNDGYIDDSTICYVPRKNGVTVWDNYYDTITTQLADNTIYEYDSDISLTVDNIECNFFNCDTSDYLYYRNNNITDSNYYSVMTYVTINEFKMLLTADAVNETFEYNADKFKKVDILQLPHHAYTGSDFNWYLYLITRPTYGVTFTPVVEINSRDRLLRTTYVAAMNTPVYSSGYGEIYVEIGDTYTLYPNNITVPGKVDTLTVPLYVNDTYVGEECGTQNKPFSTLSRALSFASTLNCYQVSIRVIGPYNHPDENIIMGNEIPITSILSYGYSSGDYPITINSITCNKGLFYLRHINVTTTDTKGVVVNDAYCYMAYMKIDGDTSAQTSLSDYAGVYSDMRASIHMENVEISNKHCAMYVANDGSITGGSVTGTNNDYLVSGYHGGSVDIGRNVSINFSEFIALHYTGRSLANNIAFNNMYAYSSDDCYVLFKDRGDGTNITTTEINLSNNVYNNAIIRVYNANGAIYQMYARTSTAISTPVLVQNVIDSSIDDSFAVSISGRILTLTYKSIVKVEII